MGLVGATRDTDPMCRADGVFAKISIRRNGGISWRRLVDAISDRGPIHDR